MSVELRKATINDISALAEMNKQLIEDERSRNPLSVNQLQLRMQSWLDGNWSAIMICKNDELIGYLLYQHRPDEFHTDQHNIYVRQFFVQRTYRRRGIGREAFEQICEQFFPANSRVVLDVLSTNPEALHFWEDIGFSRYATTLHRQTTANAQA